MKEKTIKKSVRKVKDVKTALYEKALGYDVTETVEEYSVDDGEVVLSKKKVTTKNVPPDITALKMLLESQKQVADMTDDELEEERKRLLIELSNMQIKNKENK